MDQNELPLESRYLVVPPSLYKTIFEPMVCPVQTMHLSYTDTNTVSKQKEVGFHMTDICYEFHRVRPKWFLSLRYVQRKLCTYLASRLALSPNELNKLLLEPHQLGVLLGVSKMISKPIEHLTQTMHQSCTDTNTVSKRTEVRLHKTHVT
jgi:hypothetical protein